MGQESRRSLQSRGIGTPLLVLPTVFIRDLGSDLQHHCSGLCRVDRLSPPHSVLPLGFYPAPLSGTYFARRLAPLPASVASGLPDAGGQLLWPRGLAWVDRRGRGSRPLPGGRAGTSGTLGRGLRAQDGSGQAVCGRAELPSRPVACGPEGSGTRA